MNKNQIQEALVTAMEQQWHSALNAANQAHKTASDSENKPEHQYDTLALEAAYLAHGQSERVLELEQNLLKARKLIMKEYSVDDPIGLCALAVLQDAKKHEEYFFISPVGGGMQLSIAGKTITVINPDAPVSRKLIGSYLGDEIELPTGHWQEIIALY
ncbi:hypothetical protein [Endozoicomonas numazuensis]|uniref:Transcription elongation factor GreA/GreB C-terminal domain-containing protein n=1 Tax=Endozoicomonas numazuensis TaxID=1137799 RepID=A0A081NI36_9GAMM|nr:hypothetical protein [Endozoicomonas numazuensis]KEQ18109.1 hypothetical protein GZ78_11105 [Endozoicomonas numazuensis]